MSPAMGIAVAGGPMITLPDETGRPGRRPGGDSIRSGLSEAGPVAVAGLVVNGAAALVVVAVARLVSPRPTGPSPSSSGCSSSSPCPARPCWSGWSAGSPPSATPDTADLVHRWVSRVHRILPDRLTVELVVVLLIQGWIARQLSLPNSDGIVLILVAAGIWILLCVDRGLLQAHRSYRALAGNLLVEGGVRTFLRGGAGGRLHLGVAGYALGIFVSEVAATVHAHLAGLPGLGRPPRRTRRQHRGSDCGPRRRPGGRPGARPTPVYPDPARADTALVPQEAMADVSAAFVGLALLGLLQNVDVIVLGRLDHSNVGPYAAISVASKALVFGALALGAYLLPEATIRWNEGGHAVRQLGVTLIFLAVPAAALLVIAVFVPRQFLTLVFSAKLSAGAPAFASLVGAMIFLSLSVLITNYLFGTGSRWIVFLLAAGSSLALGLVGAARPDRAPRPGPTSWPRARWPWAWSSPSSPSTTGTTAPLTMPRLRQGCRARRTAGLTVRGAVPPPPRRPDPVRLDPGRIDRHGRCGPASAGRLRRRRWPPPEPPRARRLDDRVRAQEHHPGPGQRAGRGERQHSTPRREERGQRAGGAPCTCRAGDPGHRWPRSRAPCAAGAPGGPRVATPTASPRRPTRWHRPPRPVTTPATTATSTGPGAPRNGTAWPGGGPAERRPIGRRAAAPTRPGTGRPARSRRPSTARRRPTGCACPAGAGGRATPPGPRTPRWPGRDDQGATSTRRWGCHTRLTVRVPPWTAGPTPPGRRATRWRIRRSGSGAPRAARLHRPWPSTRC